MEQSDFSGISSLRLLSAPGNEELLNRWILTYEDDVISPLAIDVKESRPYPLVVITGFLSNSLRCIILGAKRDLDPMKPKFREGELGQCDDRLSGDATTAVTLVDPVTDVSPPERPESDPTEIDLTHQFPFHPDHQ